MLLNREDKFDQWSIAHCDGEDMSLLSELRVRAIMPSLKAVNRFEAIRVVQRFTHDFQAEQTYKIILNGNLVGFYMINKGEEHHYLPYFYIDPYLLNTPLGALVLTALIEKARIENKGIRICALKGCQTKQLCLDQGFVFSNEGVYDTYYEYPNRASIGQKTLIA